MINYTFTNPEGQRYLGALKRYFNKHINMSGFPRSNTIFGIDGISYPAKKITSVSSISPDGYPILKPFWYIRSDLFKNRVSVKRIHKARNLSEHQENLKSYLKNFSDLAFILPNGMFVFKEYNETLSDTASRVLSEYPELQKDYSIWRDKILSKPAIFQTTVSELDFLVNFGGAIAFHEDKALISSKKPHYHSHLTDIWKLVLLFTDFFPHITDVVEITLE